MASQIPIRFQELFQLPNVGISPNAIGFATLTLESDKYICVRETIQEKATVSILELSNPTNVIRRPITADNAIMNPKSNIIALKAGQALQVFNLDTKERLKSHQMPDAVLYWRWIDDNTIGLVTNTAAFHWSVNGAAEPVKMFDRHPTLADCQIINYRADSSQKWLCIVGIAQREGRIAGAMQLHSMERNVSQPIEGHAACFANFTPEGAKQPSTLFAFAKRTATESKLYIIEVAKPDENPAFQRRTVDVFFPPEAAQDFPVAMQSAPKYNIIYLITKFGYLHLFDLETGALIYRNRISSDTIFVTTSHEATGGVIGVDRKGRVLLGNTFFLTSFSSLF